MKKHHKITASERDQIAWWLACGITLREMARRLGRSPSSISQELKRNKVDGLYGSIKAHQAAEARKRDSHQKYLLPHRPVLRDFVVTRRLVTSTRGIIVSKCDRIAALILEEVVELF
jgi:IS30 family transposase